MVSGVSEMTAAGVKGRISPGGVAGCSGRFGLFFVEANTLAPAAVLRPCGGCELVLVLGGAGLVRAPTGLAMMMSVGKAGAGDSGVSKKADFPADVRSDFLALGCARLRGRVIDLVRDINTPFPKGLWLIPCLTQNGVVAERNYIQFGSKKRRYALRFNLLASRLSTRHYC